MKTFAPSGRKHGVRYPWGKWFRPGRTTTIVRGVHFRSQLHGMVQTVRQAASARGLRVSVIVKDDSLKILVREE